MGLHAADLAGLKTIPAIVRDLTDDEAVILMVDSNLQRETISPMERAQAYKMKLEALKHQGKRVDLEDKSTSRQVGEKSSWAVAKVGADANESERQVHRYIRLTELLPEVQEKVESKEIAFSPAVELSYLTHDEQRQLHSRSSRPSKTPSATGYGKTRTGGTRWSRATTSCSIPPAPASMTGAISPSQA